MTEVLNKYIPYVIVVYFFNALFLPHGLLYSALLSPILAYWLYKRAALKPMISIAAIICVLGFFHYQNGAAPTSLLMSSVLFLTAFLFFLATKQFLVAIPGNSHLFKRLLIWNGLLVLLALLLLPFEIGRKWLWYEVPISPGISSFPRLKLFTYEAAYYALLFAPVFLFYFWRLIMGFEKRWLLYTIAIVAPIALSLSFGVIGALVLSLFLVIGVYYSSLMKHVALRKLLLYGSFSGLFVGVVLLLLYPDNPVYQRIINVFTGSDTSARGRLIESFMFGFDLARSKSLMLGIGLGQIKVMGHDLIINYYQYDGEYAEIVRIPNAIGELLATFGIIGVAAKIGLELWAFMRFKIYLNYFNLSLFLFIFIYQFTGSFLVNTAEIIVWCVALFMRFPEFEIKGQKQVSQ